MLTNSLPKLSHITLYTKKPDPSEILTPKPAPLIACLVAFAVSTREGINMTIAGIFSRDIKKARAVVGGAEGWGGGGGNDPRSELRLSYRGGEDE